MNLLQNENAKTNRRQKLCQENGPLSGLSEHRLGGQGVKIGLRSNLLARACFINLRSLDRCESSMLVSAGFADDSP
jgi:hypothetical protein